MSWALWVLLAVALAVAVWAGLRTRLPKLYRDRWCTGSEWVRHFPDVPKEEIRRFLAIFAGAFLFESRHRCRFSPDDKVYDVYRAMYPHPGLGADAIELETFFTDVESAYGVLNLDRLWNENLTLGELFQHVRQAGAVKGVHE